MEKKFSRKNVFMFIALNTRFSMEDLQRYDDSALKRILIGISKDSRVEDVRTFAEDAIESSEWLQRR